MGNPHRAVAGALALAEHIRDSPEPHTAADISPRGSVWYRDSIPLAEGTALAG